MHEEDLRPKFHRRWGGRNGRFQREIGKLEKSYGRKCASKNLVPRRSSYQDVNKSNRNVDEKKKNSSEARERRSGGQLRVAHNPGHRMRHIIRNVEKWTEEYLTSCNNQIKVINRWKRFVNRWDAEIQKNPVFVEEFEKEERYLRNNDGPGKPCGRIYREFGLHGQYMELRDASVDSSNGFSNLGDTDFGNDELMSMVPFEGCYIRAYEHYNKQGYSSVCSDTHGCSVTLNQYGVLQENKASSVYCYCDAPSKDLMPS